MAAAKLIAAVVAAAGLSPLTAAPVPKLEGAAAELKLLEGTWEVESVTLGGRAFPKSEPPVRYEYKGSLITVTRTKGMWSLEVDPTATPKRMTQTQVELTDGKPVPLAGGQVNQVVYELKGDKLTMVVWRGPKPEFPKSVTPEPGDPVLVTVLKRVKN